MSEHFSVSSEGNQCATMLLDCNSKRANFTGATLPIVRNKLTTAVVVCAPNVVQSDDDGLIRFLTTHRQSNPLQLVVHVMRSGVLGLPKCGVPRMHGAQPKGDGDDDDDGVGGHTFAPRHSTLLPQTHTSR